MKRFALLWQAGNGLPKMPDKPVRCRTSPGMVAPVGAKPDFMAGVPPGGGSIRGRGWRFASGAFVKRQR